jgi:hypothetical protein
MTTVFRVLIMVSLLIGTALLRPSVAGADSCELVAPHCRQCVPNDNGACCRSNYPCGCVYFQCLPPGAATTLGVPASGDFASFLRAMEGRTGQAAATSACPAVPAAPAAWDSVK